MKYESNGIGVFGLLGVLFVGLKLTGYIDWSWGWVLLPFYGLFAFAMVVAAVIVVMYLMLDKDK